MNPTQCHLLCKDTKWTIPSGWLWPDGTVSNGTPRLFNSRSDINNRIRVTPPASACAGGSAPVIRVRGVDTECLVGAAPGYMPTKSAERTLAINCIVPALNIISNRTPGGGPITLFCGERLENERVRPNIGTLPNGGAFENYSFGIFGVVKSYCCLGTATPGLYVDQVGSGSVSLSATYSRNGASTIVSASAVTVTVRPELATPVFVTTNGDLCPGNTKRFEVRPVPGATGYNWTVTPANAGFGPFSSTTVPYLDVTAPSVVGITTSYAIGAQATSTSVWRLCCVLFALSVRCWNQSASHS